MKITELLSIYQNESLVNILTHQIEKKQPHLFVKNIIGSFDAVIFAAVYQNIKEKNPIILDNFVFVMNDLDEANYFQNDLQNLLPQENIQIFPASYKRPYQFEAIENASVLQRGEVLNTINQTINKNNKNFIVITYPEALGEKVINKKSLLDNTFVLKKGEKFSIDFIVDILKGYEFEKNDFVYEAGQFAQRGGILDIYSFSAELPYRIEFFGDEIESIRSFEPISQLSVDNLNFATLIPNVHNKLTQASRESFWTFIPKNTSVFFKDYQGIGDYLEKYFNKVQIYFEMLIDKSNTQIVDSPDLLFETKEVFYKEIQNFSCVHFGVTFPKVKAEEVIFSSSRQPSFRKDFNLIVENLQQNQNKDFTNIITSDSAKQINRLESIFEEIDRNLKYLMLPIDLREGFIDNENKIVCYTEHQLFERYHRYKSKEKYSKSKALTIKELHSLQAGDYVTHIDFGIARFAGLEKREIDGKIQEAVRLVYRDNDLLYVNVHSLHKITKYSGKDNAPPSISKLGSLEWENKKKKVKKQVMDIAEDLIKIYAERKASRGFAFSPDNYLQYELESSFLYEETPDQAKAIADVKADMEAQNPMDRLVCGDVGFGKTEVAIRAAFKAVCESKQVAVLVPTTILAMQHFRTFSERLAKLPCKVDYVSRFRSDAQIKESKEKLAKGEIDIIIGTHKIAGKDFKFKDLGLLIIDEEQKFGVKTKDKLKEVKPDVDVLTLTATPIPRTLHFSLMNARDLSIIATPPPNRQPVTTEVHGFNEEIIRDAISREIRRGGQVFFVHNRVNDIDSIANLILKLVPDARICVGHGQMEGKLLEKVMLKFIDGEYDILVATNIIESGLDIPNANTIIINQAHTFGLADLHQMRGRVGRSNRKAFCYLLAPSTTLLTPETRKRLTVLTEFTDLGDGFKVAMRDLDIRGAGNMLGAEQSGFINDLGFETYHKILDESVKELKQTQFKDLFAHELKQDIITNNCNIETDLELLIPDNYVLNISERLSLYTKLDEIKDEENLKKFKQELIDRFGALPQSVKDLIETVHLRWLGEKIGFARLSLKKHFLRGWFLDKPEYFKSDRFGKVIEVLQKNRQFGTLKQVKDKPLFVAENIKNIEMAKKLLSEMILIV
ncbi:MAG: transcription-repair coupling factor [Bacteroidetes bacterium]|nr:MAG: transcription-repair coupling factor [Bacteroidota bacterium]TAG85437.1 MAG: transcription-repair coupling factor [Bacteroidota bacterium]